ncbi:hypothetical protein SpCBS45565_g06873 [Spizellomyces sp. 'palustris']|nr:hypothetical protein SpCBS45565_g06873 [Spizellomyces sp. 'palustris']
MSLREAAVYHSLCATSPNQDQIFGIFTSSNDDPATLTLDFAFFHCQPGSSEFCRLPVVISNLVESSQIQHEWFIPNASPTPCFPNNPLTSRLRTVSQQYVDDHLHVVQESLQILKQAAARLLESEGQLAGLREAKVTKARGHTASQSHSGSLINLLE